MFTRSFRFAWWCVLLGMLAAYPLLPEHVGEPGKQASRLLFQVIMVFVLAHAWLCSAPFIQWLGGKAPDLLNIPHRDYYLAPERREATLQRFGEHMSALGLQVVALTGGLYLTAVLKAHPDWPQPTPIGCWVAGVALLLCFLLWWRGVYKLLPAPPQADMMQRMDRPRRPCKPK